MFLNNIIYIIKDIYYFNLFEVEYLFINNKLIFYLNLSILIYKRDIIYKKIKVYKYNNSYKLLRD